MKSWSVWRFALDMGRVSTSRCVLSSKTIIHWLQEGEGYLCQTVLSEISYFEVFSFLFLLCSLNVFVSPQVSSLICFVLFCGCVSFLSFPSSSLQFSPCVFLVIFPTFLDFLTSLTSWFLGESLSLRVGAFLGLVPMSLKKLLVVPTLSYKIIFPSHRQACDEFSKKEKTSRWTNYHTFRERPSSRGRGFGCLSTQTTVRYYELIIAPRESSTSHVHDNRNTNSYVWTRTVKSSIRWGKIFALGSLLERDML